MIKIIKKKITVDILALSEQVVYGSSRIGVVSVSNGESEQNLSVERGNKQYELSNHLGNVLATITDRKLRAESDTVSYVADVSGVSDYYPFGSLIGSRSFSGYRFGFNG